MNFGQFLSILKARRVAAFIVFAVVVVGTVAISLLLPRQYSATASVVVDSKPDPVSAILAPALPSLNFLATQVDILTSDRVALRVVRNLKLNENPAIRQQWQDEAKGRGTIENWLAELLHKNMDVQPSRESSVIAVSYKAPDPQFAAALANAFVQAYIDVSLEMRVDPARQYSSFFDVRAKESRDSLEQSQNKLSAFQKQQGIIATDERFDVENARLNDLSTQLVTLQALASESRSRQAQARGTNADQLQEVLNNPVVAGLKADISRAEAKLQELNSRFGANHPQLIEAKASIAELKARMDGEIRRVTSGVGVTNTINQQREAQVQAELEAQRQKVLRLKSVRDEGAVLQRDVENAQRTYDTVLARLNQSSLESLTTQSNVNLLSQAVVPVEHSSPKLILNTSLAVFLGLLLAIGAAVALELADRRVRALEDVTSVTGIPLIGVLPKPTKRATGRNAPLMEQRLLGRLPSPKGSA